MPDPDDKDPVVAVMVDDKGPALDIFNCNCDKSRKTTCAHIKMLAAVYRFKQSMLGNDTLEQDFRESVWHQMATAIADGSGDTPQTVTSQSVTAKGHRIKSLWLPGGRVGLLYFGWFGSFAI